MLLNSSATLVIIKEKASLLHEDGHRSCLIKLSNSKNNRK
jgi:hypothetical protein